MTQTVDELTEKETIWLAAQMNVASSLVNCYSPQDSGSPLTLAGLDRAYAAWFSSGSHETSEINGIINAAGAAFGQFLVDQAHFRWVIATDEQGSELAILALPGQGDVLVYPLNFVAKRWERGEVDFFNDSFKRIAEDVRSIAAGCQPRPKPRWKFW